MSLVKLKTNGQVTLPSALRRKAGLNVGDLLEARLEKGKITLTPKSLIESHISESIDQIRKGQFYGPFDTAEEMIESLHSGPRERTDRFTVGASGICLILALVLLSTIAVAGSQARSEPKYLASVMVRRQVAPARAQVVLDATTRDYGEVFAGEELDYLFNVLNAGKAPLELMQRPLSSRGATPSAARLANRVLQSAGQSFELVRASARLAAPS